MSWVDIGVNLTNRAFKKDRDGVIERALAVGVRQMIVTGISERESEQAVELASRWPSCLYATAGVHPHDSRHWTQQSAERIRDLAMSDRVVAIGETGLDFNRNYSPAEDQVRAFEAQIQLAIECDLPLFLHERDAADVFIKILSRFGDELPGVVAHCFTGNGEVLKRYLNMGFYIGITGWLCDERRGQHLRSLLAMIPEDRLMLETDAPFLLPRDLQVLPLVKRRNEPCYLPHIGQAAAQCLETDVEQLAARTTANARRFFALPSGG